MGDINPVTPAPAWWNLDMYFADIISNNLRDYIRNSQSHPGDTTLAEWKAKLDNIAARLEAYTHKFDAPSHAAEAKLVKDAQDAMHEVAEIFPSLWD